jgi:hypothetical protein
MTLEGGTRMRIMFAAWMALAAVGCSRSQPAKPANAKLGDTALLHGQLLREKGASLNPDSAPPGAHLSYFGGRVVSNAQVVQVLYGAGSYLPEVTSTSTPSIATFYQGIMNSPYVDWLTEYNTNSQPTPNSNQTIGRGSFAAQVTITPSAVNDGSTIDDTQIQAELAAQIAAGTLPAPTHDAQGNNNTYYAVFFPHGKVITLGGSGSCSTFCAYHGTITNAGGAGEIYYGIHPDFQPGSGCENGCGAAATPFGNYTQVASHELIETITDAEVGLATVFGPPLAWYDQNTNAEIGDLCNDQNAQVVGGDGVTYDVQTEFSNSLNDCIATNPLVTPMSIDAHEETCRGTTATATVTLFGGGGSRFSSDVTLSLTNVSPTPPAGGEITATFDPNPVPNPAASGSTSTMRIATTATTPPGTYTLTVQGASSSLTASATTSFVVRSTVAAAPALTSPANGTDGVLSTPTFTWAAANQATAYTLEILASSDCAGTAIRSYDTAATTFTVPTADALAVFQSYSWRVSAANACGAAATSACFNFRTASCSTPRDVLSNGGFENGGLAAWTIDASVPPPVASGANPHGGSTAVLLGSVAGTTEPLGDTQISQVITVPSGGAATLVFWEWPLTADVVTFDQQYVRVTPISPAGATVVLMNEARNDQTYVRRELDLSKFAGQTVRLTFGVHQDGFGDITGMYVDDISVSVQSCGPPEFAVHVSGSDEVCAGNSATFTVSVDSVNGPNFTSPVTLGTTNLPPGTTATFGSTQLNPGESTTLTLQTTRPTIGDTYTFNVTGVAVTPPPNGVHSTATTVTIDANAPNAPELLSPTNGEVNVPRRPTLSWTAPFVPDSATAKKPAARSAAERAPFTWEMAALKKPKPLHQSAPRTGGASSNVASGSGKTRNPTPFMFGASAYHVQVASDAAFTNIVADAQVATESFTVPTDLATATQYYWRVTASNACGTSAWSSVSSFIVGACTEGWAQAAPIPLTNGPSQSTVIGASNNKLYVIGGGLGAGPDTRIDQVWAYDPQAGTWTHKTDVPAPGIGANFGSAAELNGKIYLFGGVVGPPGTVTVHRRLWRYDLASDSWSRGADLPTDNFGAAVAAVGGKIYLAYGSGLLQQTWQYDPATDGYTRKADAPLVPATNRLHGVALNGELHAFAGGFEGNAHVIYNPATDSWRLGPSMPFTATDPAVGVLGGKAVVVGGRPVAHNQIFDPATNSWSQAAPISGVAAGVDNTAGAVLGLTFHLVGGYDGTNGVSTHWQLHPCSIGGLSSAAFLPFVVDGDGKATGIGNERTSLLLDNSISGGALSVSCFLYGTDGSILGHDTISVAPNELKTVTDIVRALSHTSTVQNKIGSVALFGTDVFQSLASVVNNVSADPALEDGQSLAGATSGFVQIGSSSYVTQTVFANLGSASALVQLVAYPAAGGSSPSAASVAVVPAHGIVSTVDAVKGLGLPATFSGQLSWSSNQPVGVLVRNATKNKQYSGIEPGHSAGDAGSTVYVPYVEDTAAFSTSLELGNPGAITANVTVKFVETDDATGETSGLAMTRDIPVAINYGTPIADIVRWALRSTGTTPSGKHGFAIVTTPQKVTAQARIVDSISLDPAVPESDVTVTNGLSPILVRVDPFAFAVKTDAAAAGTQESRFALSNPGSTTATVSLTPYNATGSTALGAPFVITLAPNGQFFSENLAADMGLPPVFLGSVSIQSSAPVLVYNHRRSAQGGSPVPVH